MLVVFGGRPGVGKTTIAAEVARRSRANFVRVDSVETGIVRAGLTSSADTGIAGYAVAHQVVRSMLLEGLDVVVDAVNPIAVARRAWVDLAGELDVDHLHVAHLGIEVVCSDERLHRSRIESRRPDLPGHVMPTWDDVVSLEYEPWTDADMTLDSATSVDDGEIGRAHV